MYEDPLGPTWEPFELNDAYINRIQQSNDSDYKSHRTDIIDMIQHYVLDPFKYVLDEYHNVSSLSDAKKTKIINEQITGSYKGSFNIGNRRHGIGRLSINDKETKTNTLYIGLFRHNTPCGIGSWIEWRCDPNPREKKIYIRRYYGQFYRGKAHGYGKYCLSYIENTGFIDNTTTKNYLRNVTRYPSRQEVLLSQYVGTFKEDHRTGFGVQVHLARDSAMHIPSQMPNEGLYPVNDDDTTKTTESIYIGQMKHDKRHGYGLIVHLPNTSLSAYMRGAYIGQWRYDEPHHYGLIVEEEYKETRPLTAVGMVESVKSRYKKKCDEMTTHELSSKMVYEGGFKSPDASLDHGIRSGKGRVHYHNGNAQWGNFDKGELTNKGISINAHGDLFYGSWSNGLKDGIGIYSVREDGFDNQFNTTHVGGIPTRWDAIISTHNGRNDTNQLLDQMNELLHHLKRGDMEFNMHLRPLFALDYSPIWNIGFNTQGEFNGLEIKGMILSFHKHYLKERNVNQYLIELISIKDRFNEQTNELSKLIKACTIAEDDIIVDADSPFWALLQH